MNRHQRIGLGIAGAGLALSIVAVVVLQVDPSRMLDAHELLHRAGMAMMLIGLVIFLTVSVAVRHRERLRAALRAARAARLSSPENTRIMQNVGGALMAVAIASEGIISLIPGGAASRGSTLVLAGSPGVMIWLAGTGVAIFAWTIERAASERPAPAGVRAAPAYREWTEAAAETPSVE